MNDTEYSDRSYTYKQTHASVIKRKMQLLRASMSKARVLIYQHSFRPHKHDHVINFQINQKPNISLTHLLDN